MNHSRLDLLPLPHRNLIGHRGAAGLAPENTLEGFEKAKSLGLNWVEFDIQVCASGEWVLFHDPVLSRTTNGHGLLSQTPWQTLKTLDAGSWFKSTDQNARIPLLEDALRMLIDLVIHPNIEIKIEGPLTQTQISALVDLYHRIQSIWPTTHPPPLMSSFDHQTLVIMRSLIPKHWPLGYLLPEETPINTRRMPFDSVHCHYSRITPHFLAEAQMQNQPLLIYTVNDPKQIESFINQKIFGIFSDMTFKKIEK